MKRAVILMSSKSDYDFAEKIREELDYFGIEYEYRIASGYKTPLNVLRILYRYEASEDDIIYITVAGRSNALSGMVDANTTHPVIACPPYSDKFGGSDIYSSLRMPSGVAPMVVLDPEGAALAAAKILGQYDIEISQAIEVHQLEIRKQIDRDEKALFDIDKNSDEYEEEIRERLKGFVL